MVYPFGIVLVPGIAIRRVRGNGELHEAQYGTICARSGPCRTKDKPNGSGRALSATDLAFQECPLHTMKYCKSATVLDVGVCPAMAPLRYWRLPNASLQGPDYRN